MQLKICSDWIHRNIKYGKGDLAVSGKYLGLWRQFQLHSTTRLDYSMEIEMEIRISELLGEPNPYIIEICNKHSMATAMGANVIV